MMKSFSDEIYQKVSGGHLQPVLDTILAMQKEAKRIAQEEGIKYVYLGNV